MCLIDLLQATCLCFERASNSSLKFKIQPMTIVVSLTPASAKSFVLAAISLFGIGSFLLSPLATQIIVSRVHWSKRCTLFVFSKTTHSETVLSIYTFEVSLAFIGWNVNIQLCFFFKGYLNQPDM